ncbi:group II intron reverse transcriptase/maturase [Nocardia sp. NPDC059246]|uniref:group II intron reverse transcriptase/maturase n=1 Tax=unclassified Nocardia TaxID=2637762 RepID=UPI0036C91C14
MCPTDAGKRFIGPKAEAEEIKQRLTRFLREELKLELSQDKTLITHACTEAAKFLGYEITVLHNDGKLTHGKRSVNGVARLRVPSSVIKAKQAPYLARGKPERRPNLLNEDDHTIVNVYGAEWRGIVQYYLLAGNVSRLYRLLWVMETSLLKTLANKHRSTVSKMARAYATTITTPYGPRKCFEAKVERSGRKPLVARFGGIPLRRQLDAAITDRVLVPGIVRRTELVNRLQAGRCEICRSTEDISVHHIRRLADLDRPGQTQPDWVELMVKRRRKTLVVCRSCHDGIHAGKSKSQLTS